MVLHTILNYIKYECRKPIRITKMMHKRCAKTLNKSQITILHTNLEITRLENNFNVTTYIISIFLCKTA